MIPYFLLFGLPILAWLIGDRYRITINKRVLLESNTVPIDLFMLVFFLMLTLRGLNCGNDTIQYYRIFHDYGKMSYAKIIEAYDQEQGFRLLSKFVYEISENYQFFLGVTSGVCVLPLWYFYRRESQNQLLTIAAFLAVAPFIMYFSGIRQAVAMSLGILAWYAAKNKRPIYFLLIVFLAMQFHNSAFMLILIYPLYIARITKKWLFLVIPFMIFVYVFKVPIFNFLLQFLWEEYETTPETGATTTLVLLIIFAVYSYVIPDDAMLDRDLIGLRNILLLSVVIQFFVLLHPLAMRMNYYFLLFVPVLIPKIAARSKKGFEQVTKLSVNIMIVYFLYFFVNKMVKDIDSLNIFPYIPFWQNGPHI